MVLGGQERDIISTSGMYQFSNRSKSIFVFTWKKYSPLTYIPISIKIWHIEFFTNFTIFHFHHGCQHLYNSCLVTSTSCSCCHVLARGSWALVLRLCYGFVTDYTIVKSVVSVTGVLRYCYGVCIYCKSTPCVTGVLRIRYGISRYGP